jgi:peptidyl-prolyl cis-trans isomerase B (cyclophilin B)
VDLNQVSDVTDLPVADLTPAAASKVQRGIDATDAEHAERIVATLRGQRLPLCPAVEDDPAPSAAAPTPAPPASPPPAPDGVAPTDAAPTDAAPTDAPAADVLGACAFTPTPAEAAAKPAPVPALTEAPTTGTAAVALQTDRGAIPLTLDRSTGPCAVENFLSLTAAGYYDATPCHRLTASPGLSVLQCGDPTGTGSGGPGYTVNDEPPTALAPDPGGNGAIYPRGTVAMAKTSAPDSGGSQFFLVYADSTLPPDYTVFGTIGAEGLATLDAIGAAGTADGGPDGAPAQPVTILTATAA